MIFYLILALCSFPAFSHLSIKGRVINANNNRPLQGASVTLVDSNDGVVTDQFGDFRLTANSDEVILIIQHIGFEKQELKIGKASQNLIINLSSILI